MGIILRECHSHNVYNSNKVETDIIYPEGKTPSDYNEPLFFYNCKIIYQIDEDSRPKNLTWNELQKSFVGRIKIGWANDWDKTYRTVDRRCYYGFEKEVDAAMFKIKWG